MENNIAVFFFETAEQKNEKKRELAKRLVEINARKREERLAEDRLQLQKLENIKKCHERGETKEYQKQMRQNLISNREELEVSLFVSRQRCIDKQFLQLRFIFFLLIKYRN